MIKAIKISNDVNNSIGSLITTAAIVLPEPNIENVQTTLVLPIDIKPYRSQGDFENGFDNMILLTDGANIKTKLVAVTKTLTPEELADLNLAAILTYTIELLAIALNIPEEKFSIIDVEPPPGFSE